MNYCIIEKMKRYMVRKLVEGLREAIDFIDDGYHNTEVNQLEKISNKLIDSLKEDKG